MMDARCKVTTVLEGPGNIVILYDLSFSVFLDMRVYEC